MGHAALWGISLICNSWILFSLTLFSQISNFGFLELVEGPHMKKIYGEKIRKEAGLIRGVKKELAKVQREWGGKVKVGKLRLIVDHHHYHPSSSESPFQSGAEESGVESDASIDSMDGDVTKTMISQHKTYHSTSTPGIDTSIATTSSTYKSMSVYTREHLKKRRAKFGNSSSISSSSKITGFSSINRNDNDDSTRNNENNTLGTKRVNSFSNAVEKAVNEVSPIVMSAVGGVKDAVEGVKDAVTEGVKLIAEK